MKPKHAMTILRLAGLAITLPVGLNQSAIGSPSSCAVGGAGFIQVGNKSSCVRRMTPTEIQAAEEAHRRTIARQEAERRENNIRILQQQYKDADRRVKDGYDPNVSMQEFMRRLDSRSEINNQLNQQKYGY